MAQLTLRLKNQTLWTQTITGKRIRIGRDPDADIVLSDPEVSRIHLILENDGGAYRLLDNSRNGTWVNGVKKAVTRLKEGDSLRVGPFELQYHHTDANNLSPSTLQLSPAKQISYAAYSQHLLANQELLIIRDGPRAPFSYTPKGKMRVGASSRSDIILRDAGRNRCELTPGPKGLHIQAHGPNIRLNNKACKTGIMTYGSRLQLGDSVLEYCAETVTEKLPALAPSNASEATLGMVGHSEALAQVLAVIHRVAPSPAPVLILGETGTGKELVAKALHTLSGRNKAPFVAINCGAISKELAESELFGHLKGAFTGAITPRKGAFREADGGTLLLDEVGELPPHLQVKLLRILETGAVTPIGSSREIVVNVRIVAATHRDLMADVESGRFRQDLFFRLFVIPIQLPPLRERKEDIPLLVSHFLKDMAADIQISPETSALLMGHPWPGNIRELRHALTRAVAMTPSKVLHPEHINLLSSLQSPASSMVLPPLVSLEEMEKGLIKRALRETHSRKEAAIALGIARSTLHLKLKKYELDG